MDAKTIKNLQPKECEYRLKIAECRGLFLVVYPSGTKSFVYRRREPGGKSRSKFLGYVGDVTVAQAVQKAGELNLMIGRGENPFARAEAQLTLRSLFDYYLQAQIKRERKSVARLPQDFELRLGSIADWPVDKITRLRVQMLHIELGTDRGHYTANRAIQLGKAIYNYANKLDLSVQKNPFSSIPLYKERPRKRALSIEECQRIFTKLLEDDTQIGNIVLLGLLTGARKTDILSMTWGQIHRVNNKKVWIIPETKNGSEQVIPLSELELEILTRQTRKTNTQKYEFVFMNFDTGNHLIDPRRSWTKLKQELGLEDCHYHDLRRSLGSAMANAQINLSTVQETLGHKSIEVTAKHYTQITSDAILDAKRKVQEQWIANEP